MRAITNQTTEASLGTYFVRLFEVDADQFQLRDTKAPLRPGLRMPQSFIRIERLDAPSHCRWCLTALVLSAELRREYSAAGCAVREVSRL